MNSPVRTVRRLHLRASEPDSVRRVILRLEDALRIASLRDEGGRLLLVRRLGLGRLDREATAQTLALSLEQAVAQLGSRCVHGAEPAAAQAEAVWFRDALDAHATLALHLLGGKSVTAWFWPLAIPAIRRTSQSEWLREMAWTLSLLPEAAAALPQWVAIVVQAGHADALLDALEPKDAEVFTRVCGLTLPPEPLSGLFRPAAWLDGESAASTSRFRHLSHSPDPRRQWLAAVLASLGIPHPAESVGLNQAAVVEATYRRSSDLSESGGPYRLDEGERRLEHSGSISPIPKDLPAAELIRIDEPKAGAFPADPPAQSAPPTAALPYQSEPATAAHPVESAESAEFSSKVSSPWPLMGVATAAGGLALLLPVLSRCGLVEWLEQQPEWRQHDIVRRVFFKLLTLLDLSPEDPAWHLALSNPALTEMPDGFIAPSLWRQGLATDKAPRYQRSADGGVLFDGSGRLLLAAWRGLPPPAVLPLLAEATEVSGLTNSTLTADAVATAWLTTCRRWLRRYGQIGLASLVNRPARLSVSPTHIDLYFRLNQADMRVRRLGLDINPGWLPWYGRIVTLHYSDDIHAVPQQNRAGDRHGE